MNEALLEEQARLQRRLLSKEGPGLHKMSEITSHIFLSSRALSENWEQLRDNNIRAILTVEETPKASTTLKRYKSMHIAHRQVRLDDTPRAPLLKELDACFDFIHEHVSQQRSVLVHCQRGVSRSVAVVAAYYLRRLYALSFKQTAQFTRNIIDAQSFLLGIALDKIQESRPCAKPNSGFILQLLIYELRLKRPYRERLEQELREFVDRRRREKEDELGEEVDIYREEFQMTMDEYLEECFRGESATGAPGPHGARREERELPSDLLSEIPKLVERLRQTI